MREPLGKKLDVTLTRRAEFTSSTIRTICMAFYCGTVEAKRSVDRRMTDRLRPIPAWRETARSLLNKRYRRAGEKRSSPRPPFHGNCLTSDGRPPCRRNSCPQVASHFDVTPYPRTSECPPVCRAVVWRCASRWFFADTGLPPRIYRHDSGKHRRSVLTECGATARLFVPDATAMGGKLLKFHVA